MEIEDVLSSIRRLVTEEGRDGSSRKRPSDKKGETTRLMLTPALRVEPEPETRSETEVERQPEEGESAPFQLSAEYVAPEAAEETDLHSETREIDPEAPWSDPTVTLHEAAALVENRGDEGESEGVSEDSAESDAAVELSSLSDDDLLLSEEDALEPEPLDWREPEAGEAAEVEAAENAAPELDTSEQDEELAPEPEGEAEVAGEPELDVVVQVQSVEEPVSTTRDMRNATLSAKIQALEAAIAQTEDQWEPDGSPEDGDFAAMPIKTIPWQDEPPATVETVTPPPPAIEAEDTTGAQAPQQGDEDGETILDEETLRRLVADIVRQELQGALGERITRNVRKLVRREIHRALTAQELD
jgi:hypothetical protein